MRLPKTKPGMKVGLLTLRWSNADGNREGRLDLRRKEFPGRDVYGSVNLDTEAT